MDDVGVAATVWAIGGRLAYVGWVGAALRRVRAEAGPREPFHPDFDRFRKIASFLMVNDAVAIVVLSVITRDTIAIAWLPAFLLGAVLTAVGITCKTWACTTLGWGACVWEDFFHGPVPGGGRWNGPYRFLDNPMYTVGYLHAWGFPLMLRSGPGIVAGLFAHVSILAFLWIVERPHARAHYARVS